MLTRALKLQVRNAQFYKVMFHHCNTETCSIGATLHLQVVAVYKRGDYFGMQSLFMDCAFSTRSINHIFYIFDLLGEFQTIRIFYNFYNLFGEFTKIQNVQKSQICIWYYVYVP